MKKMLSGEKCCGVCCWFKFEDTDGWGHCFSPVEPTRHSSRDFCNCGMPVSNDRCGYVSEEQKRHYMAVLIQANRYRRDQHVPAWHKMPNPTELGKAIDFAVKYMKTL